MFFSKAITTNTTRLDMKYFCMVMSVCEFIRGQADAHEHSRRLQFNCHPIHRAISHIIPDLKVRDGYYFGMAFIEEDGVTKIKRQETRHSWLVTPDSAIIDAYPVGILSVNPVLVVTKGPFAPSGGNLYFPDQAVTREYCATREVFRKTQILVQLAKGWKCRP